MESFRLIYTRTQELAVWHSQSRGEMPFKQQSSWLQESVKKLFYMFDWEHFPELG